ncbi:MAG: hypothetical protein K2X82_15295 [Gemmataceae bacterium]|nr:hypothetical protein [Gemmataceae bacterium]
MPGAGDDDGQPQWVPSFGFYLVTATTVLAVGGVVAAAWMLVRWWLGQLGPLGPGDGPPAGQSGWD